MKRQQKKFKKNILLEIMIRIYQVFLPKKKTN